jgi:hypothetical protein
MATKLISKVRVQPAHAPRQHEHIAAVMLSDGSVEARSTVIARIYGGDQYVTAANPPGRVYVHPCPYCRARDYITTHPDNTATNNLLHLPRF